MALELTNVSVIKDLCERHGFALSKGFGQNFIVNPGICPKMVHAAGIDERALQMRCKGDFRGGGRAAAAAVSGNDG